MSITYRAILNTIIIVGFLGLMGYILIPVTTVYSQTDPNLPPACSPPSCPTFEDLQPDGCSCKPLFQSNVVLDPANPELGQDVTVTVHSTKTCVGGLNLNPGAGLHDRLDFDLPNCAKVSQVCGVHNGVDDLRCTIIFNCIAFHESDILLDNNFQAFIAEVTSTNNAECRSTRGYVVTEPRECVNRSPLIPLVDSRGTRRKEVVVPTFTDDLAQMQVQAQGTLPTEINREIVDAQQARLATNAPLPEIGVEVGFFNIALIRNLVCNNFVTQLIALLGFRFCPVDLNFTQAQTEHLLDMSERLILEQRPREITPTPYPRSCYFVDDAIINQIIQQRSLRGVTRGQLRGNEDLDKWSRAAGTHTGWWDIGVPPIPDLFPDTVNFNASLYQKTFPDEQRPPDSNCRQSLFFTANYPGEFAPDGGCSTTDTSAIEPTPTPLPTPVPEPRVQDPFSNLNRPPL